MRLPAPRSLVRVAHRTGSTTLIELSFAAPQHAEVAAELPGFAARIREIVEAHELRVWFDTVRRIGPLGHAASDAAYEALAAAGSIGDDPVLGAEEVLALDRARDLLLGER